MKMNMSMNMHVNEYEGESDDTLPIQHNTTKKWCRERQRSDVVTVVGGDGECGTSLLGI